MTKLAGQSASTGAEKSGMGRFLPASGPLSQRLRLATGLILFAFVLTHLGNHALGLISIEAMQMAREWRTAVTRSLPGQTLLIAAVVVHMALGFYKFLRRRGLRMSVSEFVALVFGLALPLLLARHIIGTGVAHRAFGINDDYKYALGAMWPDEALRQALLITLAWVHGCIGIFYWLRLRPWFNRVRDFLLGFAILLPVLSYAGFAMSARLLQLETEFQSPFTSGQYQFLVAAMNWALYGFLGFLILLVAVRVAVEIFGRLRPQVRVTYAGDRTYRMPAGYTLLEISRRNGVPHASICGGRARCSTCRVRVLKGLEQQPAPGAAETRVLTRIAAGPHIRLACQLRPRGEIEVATLLPATRTRKIEDALYDKYYWGVEEQVTVMFCDLRNFTKFSEKRLPFDVVFVLNHYLGQMGEAIEEAGGYVDKFIGDGIMAIFGIGRPVAEGARQSLAAARAMGGVLEALNMSLKNDLPEPLDIALGINTGTVILGRIGSPEKADGSRHITALGDTVNAASRLEQSCRDLSVQTLVAAATVAAAQANAAGMAIAMLSVKGKQDQIGAVQFRRALDVPAAWAQV